MAQRQQRRRAGHGPPRGAQAPHEEDARTEEQKDAEDVEDRERRGEIHWHDAEQSGDRFVAGPPPHLRREKGRVSWEQRAVDRAGHGRDVERLVGDAVAIAAGIRGGDDQEGERRSAQTQPGDHMRSSAVGPYTGGSGTSFSRRYTVNWPRWWIA